MGTLFLLIHGSQKSQSSISDLRINVNSDQLHGTWNGTYRFTVFDDFGFDQADRKTNWDEFDKNCKKPTFDLEPPFVHISCSASLFAKAEFVEVAFYLQIHGRAFPYGLELAVEEGISGSF